MDLKTLTDFKFVNEFWTFLLPLIFMLADFLTGTVNAWIKGDIKSSKMREGLGKKFGEIAIILLTNVACYALQINPQVCAAVVLYVVVMECISVFENLGKLGVPIPAFVKKALHDFAEKVDNGDKDVME